jgi:hypothetical protein
VSREYADTAGDLRHVHCCAAGAMTSEMRRATWAGLDGRVVFRRCAAVPQRVMAVAEIRVGDGAETAEEAVPAPPRCPANDD